MGRFLFHGSLEVSVWKPVDAGNFFFFFLELYYGGDTVSSEQPQSYTCPYCGNMGFSEVSLSEHVNVQHSDSSSEVVSI